MKVKVFSSVGTGKLEEEVNKWLSNLPVGASVKSTQLAATHRSADAAIHRPVVVIAVWYEETDA